MTWKAVAALAATILASSPAVCDVPPDQVRARLLAAPSWVYEWTHRSFVNAGKVRFVEQDGKLVGYIDAGWQCDNEVTLRANGFDMKTCADNELQFTLSGDEFKATKGNYTYTVRPANK